MPTVKKRKRTDVVLRPVHPNAGIEAAYRQKLQRLIGEMHRSVLYWLKAAYRANEPVLAQDEGPPAAELNAAVERLAKRWRGRFNVMADELAEYFATAVEERSASALQSILRRGGISVRFQMTAAMRDVMAATIEQQVGLIKSIPQDYLTEVQGLVMRSVQTGRDLGQLTTDLEARYDITRRRAALIARDQNDKATASMTRARQEQLGITEALWQHSGGGKHPRPKHVAASGKKYDIKRGLPIGDKGQYVFPGEEINCRCVARSVIAGFE